MLILYAAMKHDYGHPERGLSFEHSFAFDTLHRMGHDILYFDFMALLAKYGRSNMNRSLAQLVAAEKPSLLFTFLYQDQLDKRTIRRITDSGVTTTFNWFADDHWRFETFSRYWAPCFNFVATTDANALPKYQAIGYNHALKTQWAVNHFTFHPPTTFPPPAYDITFVGQPHGARRQIISSLQTAGIKVECWGQGWPNGRLTQDEMIKVFSTSRINLNFSASSVPNPTAAQHLKAALSHHLLNFPLGHPAKRLLSKARNLFSGAGNPAPTSAAEMESAGTLAQPVPSPASPPASPPQFKARIFEVPACGGFLLTDYCQDLESYYDLNSEIVCFSNPDDLREKILYYLAHEDQRAAIAAAAHRRTLRQHTYVHRFNELFAQMGLPHVPPEEISLAPAKSPGKVIEIT